MDPVSDRYARYHGHESSITGNASEFSFRHIGDSTKRCDRIDRATSMRSRRLSTSASNSRSVTMVLSFIYLVVLFDPFAATVSAQSTAVVRTSTGPVQGEILRTVVKGNRYSAFKGIPYAKPPLRYLRFKVKC